MRRTVRQLRQTRFPTVLGICADNLPLICSAVNEVTQRLINEFGEWGLWGSWSKIAFTVTRCIPYFTLPRQFSRLINADVCRFPIRIQNEFYEMLDDGIGLRSPIFPGGERCICGPLEAYDRGSWPSQIDLIGSNSFLRIYITNPADIGKQVLIGQCLDQNGLGIYTDNLFQSTSVDGVVLTLESPFVDTPMVISSFKTITKDLTQGDIILMQVDATTGTETTLSRYSPDETNPAYRRYYFGNLPWSCCNPPNIQPNVVGQVNITAMAKMEYFPVQQDSDTLLIGNFPALIEEAQSVNYSSMESAQAMALTDRHHKRAVTLLQQELTHYLGKNLPAVNFNPFGAGAGLNRAGVGTLI